MGAGDDAADVLFRFRILEILWRTLLLVGAVTAASIILSLPLAWLTVRTDLPYRKAWAVLTALPLVIPSYVGGFIVVVVLGPRGMLQKLLDGPFGVDRLPDIHGFTGAMLTLTFLSYPYVLLTVRAALLRMDPALEESSRGLGRNQWSTFFRVTLLQLRPAIAAGGLLVALYTLSDFGVVSLLRYETFTWAIFIEYESTLDRNPGCGHVSGLSSSGVGHRGRGGIHPGPFPLLFQRAGHDKTSVRVRLGYWRWPSLFFVDL